MSLQLWLKLADDEQEDYDDDDKNTTTDYTTSTTARPDRQHGQPCCPNGPAVKPALEPSAVTVHDV